MPTDAISIDDYYNEKAITSFIEILKTRRAICFVGAGLSSAEPLNYPNWEQLFLKIQDFAIEHCVLTSEQLNALKNVKKIKWASNLKKAMEKERPGSYGSFFRKEYGQKSPGHTTIQEILTKLPFQHFLTTNYDPSLEEAESYVRPASENSIVWNDEKSVGELLRTLDHPNINERKIFHIHGKYNNEISIVLTEEEFDNCYDREKGYMYPAMWGFLSMKSLVFIGFSFNEEDQYTEIINRYQSHLHPFFQSHIAFCNLKEQDFRDQKKRNERRKYFNNKGIDPIFYPVFENDNHEALESVLKELENRYSREQQPKESPPKDSSTITIKTNTEYISPQPIDNPDNQKKGAEILKKIMKRNLDK